MKNREEGDCPTYSLFYAKVQLCSKNNFSPCSKHFGKHSHINKNMIKLMFRMFLKHIVLLQV